jgi:hypothetical protein
LVQGLFFQNFVKNLFQKNKKNCFSKAYQFLPKFIFEERETNSKNGVRKSNYFPNNSPSISLTKPTWFGSVPKFFFHKLIMMKDICCQVQYFLLSCNINFLLWNYWVLQWMNEWLCQTHFIISQININMYLQLKKFLNNECPFGVDSYNVMSRRAF